MRGLRSNERVDGVHCDERPPSDDSKESAEGRRVDFNTFAAELAARRAALIASGKEINMPRNSGERRTDSKRALLKAIEDVGGKW